MITLLTLFEWDDSHKFPCLPEKKLRKKEQNTFDPTSFSFEFIMGFRAMNVAVNIMLVYGTATSHWQKLRWLNEQSIARQQDWNEKDIWKRREK